MTQVSTLGDNEIENLFHCLTDQSTQVDTVSAEALVIDSSLLSPTSPNYPLPSMACKLTNSIGAR